MASLVKFELKKILGRRVTQVSLAVLFVLSLLFMGLNVLQQAAVNPVGDPPMLSGTAAIAQQRVNAQQCAGPITDEAVAAVVGEFRTFLDEDGEVKAPYDDPDTPEGAQFRAWYHTRFQYLSLVLGPWMQGYEVPGGVAARGSTAEPLDVYGQAAAKLAATLADPNGRLTYTPVEQAFWLSRYDKVPKPVEYGYAGGWDDVLNCLGFLLFAMMAVVLACAPVFTAEYQQRTDAVVLATRCGKTKLPWAKVTAAVVFATVAYGLFALVIVGVPLAFFGADGAALPVQMRSLTSAWGLTMAQTAVVGVGLGYAALLALLAVTLLLSARLRSPMAIFAIGIAVLVAPLLVPSVQNNVVNHLLYLLPYFVLDGTTLLGPVSYAAGPLVLDYHVALLAVYAATVLICVPLAARTFAHHQVA